MTRPSRERATPVLLVLWVLWSAAWLYEQAWHWLIRRTPRYKAIRRPGYDVLEQTRRFRALRVLLWPGHRIALAVARWAHACPVCFWAEPCPYHWRSINRVDTHARRNLKKTRKGAATGTLTAIVTIALVAGAALKPNPFFDVDSRSSQDREADSRSSQDREAAAKVNPFRETPPAAKPNPFGRQGRFEPEAL